MIRSLAGILALLLAAGAARGQAARAQTPLAYLSRMVTDADKAAPTFATLRGTEDKHLAPLFRALARSGDKQRRMFGLLALAELMGAEAGDVLLDRLQNDPTMPIRAAALARLIDLKAITNEQLANALSIPDENVQCLAARELVHRGQAGVAVGVLEKLAASKDPATSSLSRMCLLGLGRRDQEPALRKVMRDPKTPPAALLLLLRQIERQKITAAMGLALHVATAEEHPSKLKARAYQAVSAISSLGAVTLRDAILKSRRTVFRAQVLKVLSSRDDAGGHLQAIAKGKDPVAALARFELARKTGGPTAAGAVIGVIDLQHPVLVAYVLDRAGEDIKARGKEAGFYTPGLLKYIRSVDPKPTRMGKEHFFAAGAAARLIQLGTPEAIAGLKQILSGRKSAISRSAAAGLLRAKNPAARALVKPLLNSPYGELATDAALVLGHFGDPAAAGYLRNVLAHPKRYPPALLVLASWYLLKIDKQTRPAAAKLAKLVK